jgi:hypothetical protein
MRRDGTTVVQLGKATENVRPDSDWFRPKYHSDNEQVNDQTVQGRTRSPGTPPVNKESEFITYLLITHELQRTRYAAAAARPHHGCGRRRYADENPKNRRSDNGQKIVWLSGESRREKSVYMEIISTGSDINRPIKKYKLV